MYYIAYGSNLNVTQMKYRCPTAKVVAKGTLPGYRLMFKGSKTGSYLTIEKDETCVVPIVLWKTTKADEAALDRYEGFPHFYYKRMATVNLPDIGKVKAYVYIMHEDRPLGIPTQSYVFTCLEGYRHFGLDEERLFEAIEYSMKGAKV